MSDRQHAAGQRLAGGELVREEESSVAAATTCARLLGLRVNEADMFPDLGSPRAAGRV
jgi:hypothetical protein